MKPGRIAITGATGLIGAALCRRLARNGWTVHALARRPEAVPTAPGVTALACDLPDRLDAGALAGCHAVIHAAYATRAPDRRRAAAINEEGTRRVLEAARAADVQRFIFVSSIAAHAGARSYYARSKFRLESLLDPARDLALRPGLVLDTRAGLFSRLLATVRMRRIIPLPAGGGQPLQTVDLDDLATAFEIALERDLTGVLTVAAPDPVTLRSLLELSAARLSRRVRFVAVPAGAAMAGLRMAEALRIPLPVTSDSLLGLLSGCTVDTRPDLARLGLSIRDTARSLDHLLQ